MVAPSVLIKLLSVDPAAVAAVVALEVAVEAEGKSSSHICCIPLLILNRYGGGRGGGGG